jgi:Protein of unknown function (DUF559)
VDGKIHDKEFLKTPDRIRQRALKNMGFEVHRVRNERIQSAPYAVAADIIQKYYKVADVTDKAAKVTKLKAATHHESRGVFGEQEGNTAAIHLKNMYNITAPGFFKNLFFKGGPNLNPGVISIKDRFTLDSIINNFNKNFSSIGITVESRFSINSFIFVIFTS